MKGNRHTTDVEQALLSRRSVRAYLPDPVSRETVEALLTVARAAPSGANLQPGRFHVMTGEALQDFCRQLCAAASSDREQVSEYSYFPMPLAPELKAKQRKTGYALYKALGIERRDIEGRRAQFDRNYRFFDAPVGIVVTISRDMGKGGFMDLGMSLMSLFAAAEGRGLGMSGIGALAHYGDVAHQVLNLPESEMIVCGLALGHADWDHPVNGFRTERDALKDFTTFQGFEA